MVLLIIFMLVTMFMNIYGQSGFNYYLSKPGSCPPPLSVQICSKSCVVDSHCFENEKCCSTNCGGSICTTPVTMRDPIRNIKPGSCPITPTGRWVCSSTCSVDSDCFGARKCCRNRCGALACQKPDVEVIPSVEIPVTEEPEILNNIGNIAEPYPAVNSVNPFLLNTYNYNYSNNK